MLLFAIQYRLYSALCTDLYSKPLHTIYTLENKSCNPLLKETVDLQILIQGILRRFSKKYIHQ